jgi:hypothetical protein
MKIQILKFVTILLTTIFTISCSNNDDNNSTNPTPTPSTSFIRCKIDGVNYEATGAMILANQNSVAFNIDSYVLTGGTGLDFSIVGQAAVGTYNFNVSNLSTAGRLQYRVGDDIFTTAKCASSGTLTITAKNGNTIEGTFSYTAQNFIGLCTGNPTKNITEGTFKVIFQ